MLIDFSFSNFKSFWKQQRFSMEREAQSEEDTVSINSISAVYGGNAAGKSNFIEAIRYMSDFVRDSFSSAASKNGTRRSANRLVRDAARRVSNFYVRFTTESQEKKEPVQYEYEFSVDDDRVMYERLDVWLSSRASKVFERTASYDEDGSHFTYGARFRGARSVYEQSLKDNALMLSVMASAGNKLVTPAYEYLAHSIHTYKASEFGDESDRIVFLMQRRREYVEAFRELVRGSDLGIDGLDVNTDTYDRLLSKINDARNQDALRDFYSAFIEIAEDEMPTEEKNRLVDRLMNQPFAEEAKPGDLVFIHRGEDRAEVFDANDESDGTLAMIAFLSITLRELSNHSVTIVDEIDTSLHPAMVRQLVDLYTDERANPHKSQLIFSTHDVSLLMKAIDGGIPIDPDQFWIIEKRDGASELFPATALGIDDDENMARNYLNGIYGGVQYPNLTESFIRARLVLEGIGNRSEGTNDGEA